MKATKLFVENHLAKPLYVLTKIERRVFRLFVYAAPKPNAQELPAGKFMSFAVSDTVRSCYAGTRLNYEIINRSGGNIIFEGGRERRPEGPVFKVEAILN